MWFDSVLLSIVEFLIDFFYVLSYYIKRFVHAASLFSKGLYNTRKINGTKEIKQNLKGPKNFDIKFAHIDCYSQNFISET